MRHDALIIGGSFAGLSAAMPLARARRQVLVIDAGQPRNRFASHSHGVLGHDGKPGSQLLAEARAQLMAYPTVQFVTGQASAVTRQASADGDFVVEVEVDDGQRWFTGRRLLLATGVADKLPPLPGLAERWGRTVLHCPYCHGYEIGGGAIGVLGVGAGSQHQALLLPDWGDVTFFTQGIPELVHMSAEDSDMLARRGVVVEHTPVVQLLGDTPALHGVKLADGRELPLKALLTGSRATMASPLAESLGCRFEDGMAGAFVATDAMKQSSVPGVFAAGDMARGMHNINFALADGMMAGVALHRDLIMEEAQGAPAAAAAPA